MQLIALTSKKDNSMLVIPINKIDYVVDADKNVSVSVAGKLYPVYEMMEDIVATLENA